MGHSTSAWHRNTHRVSGGDFGHCISPIPHPIFVVEAKSITLTPMDDPSWKSIV